MKTEDHLRKLADEGTQGRWVLDPSGLSRVRTPDGDEIADTVWEGDSERIALMADADMMRAIADVVEAARELHAASRRFQYIASPKNPAPPSEHRYLSANSQLVDAILKNDQALARLDALTQEKNDA